MRAHPRLWRHGILPVVFNLLLSVLLLAGLVYGSIWAFGRADAMLPDGMWWKFLEFFIGVLLVVLVVVLLIAAWFTFQGILCGYFYSELAREMEIQLGMKPGDMREVPLTYQVIDALKDLGALTTVAIGCLVLGFVPVVGPVAAIVVGGYFDCFVLGMDYLDYPQALRARDRRTQRIFARRHRLATLGLGASVLLITFVPILSSILLTSAVAGAVLLYRRLEAADASRAAGPR